MINQLSVITITYNNQDDLIKTYNSLKSFRNAGGTHIIVNGGSTVQDLIETDCVLIEGSDKGIYDALNKGIELVNTKYLMLIHAGDFLVKTIDVLETLITKMDNYKLDLILNDCTIEFGKGKRLMSAKNWRPWMFKLGAQPPHPPIIYRHLSIKDLKYDIRQQIIADFDYLERIFKSNPKYDKGDEVLIHMSAGGLTSSGFSSFIAVHREFVKLKGTFVSLYFFFTRPIIKIILMF